MRGHIQRRGKSSWRLKVDVGRDSTGKRHTHFVTVRGKRQDAERELTRLLSAVDSDTLVNPSKITVREHLWAWLDNPHGLSPKTCERYRQLAEQQIFPHLGGLALQKLRPAAVQCWHATLLKSGGKGGRSLSARTVGHAHRVLRRALQRAVEAETLGRNVAATIRPPKVEAREIQILTSEQMVDVLRKLEGRELHPIVSLALATGMRRGELLAVQWQHTDLDGASVRVERALEETSAGLRFKVPKSKQGRRTISLPPSTIAILREHRRKQLEIRLALGLGRPDPDALVFCKPDGSPLSPDNLSRDWRRVSASLRLPQIMFHALRHTHASALIASGLDVVTVSRRLGHASPTVTLNIYCHLFSNSDAMAAVAIEAALRTGKEL